MVTAIYAASVLLAVLVLGDMMRRPESEWAAADRERSWWISMTVVLGFLACGIFMAVAYAIGVLPRFGQRQAVDHSFSKAPAARAAAPVRARPAPPPPAPPAGAWDPATARPTPTPPPTAARGEDGRLIVEFDDL